MLVLNFAQLFPTTTALSPNTYAKNSQRAIKYLLIGIRNQAKRVVSRWVNWHEAWEQSILIKLRSRFDINYCLHSITSCPTNKEGRIFVIGVVIPQTGPSRSFHGVNLHIVLLLPLLHRFEYKCLGPGALSQFPFHLSGQWSVQTWPPNRVHALFHSSIQLLPLRWI